MVILDRVFVRAEVRTSRLEQECRVIAFEVLQLGMAAEAQRRGDMVCGSGNERLAEGAPRQSARPLFVEIS